MISFKQFISEADGKWVVDEHPSDNVDNTIARLDSFCPGWEKLVESSSSELLYRGFIGGLPTRVVSIDSTDSFRTSRDTNNAYQLLIDSSSSTKKFASRSRSIICTTALKTARIYSNSNYQNIYVIFPKMGQSLTCSEQADFIDHKLKHFGNRDLDTFSMKMGYIFTWLGAKMDENGRYTDRSAIAKVLSSVDPEVLSLLLAWNLDTSVAVSYIGQEDNFGPRVKKWLDSSSIDSDSDLVDLVTKEFAAGNFKTAGWVTYVYKHLKSTTKRQHLSALASFIMTPESLGLTHATFGNTLPAGIECWFTGKCIAVALTHFDEIAEALLKSGRISSIGRELEY